MLLLFSGGTLKLGPSPSVNLATANFFARLFSDTTAQKRDAANPSDDWLPEHVCPVGASVSPQQTINFVAAKLGVQIPSSFNSQLVFYMNNFINSRFEYVEIPYDSLDSSLVRRKCLGLYYILAMFPDFLSK